MRALSSTTPYKLLYIDRHDAVAGIIVGMTFLREGAQGESEHSVSLIPDATEASAHSVQDPYRRFQFILRMNFVERLLEIATDANDMRPPQIARTCIVALGAQQRTLNAQILEFDRRITAWHRSNETSKRLDQIPGVVPALATALVATVVAATLFGRLESNDVSQGRCLVPWIFA
jgi:hypothetical protein